MTDPTPTRLYYETRELCHRDVYRQLANLRKSLLELKLKSNKELLENTLYWQQEVEKAKEKKDQEWLDRVNAAEAENKKLKELVQKLKSSNGFMVRNDLLLYEAENQIDKLSRQLDEKLIHINKLQIAHAEQSKTLFELERSYVLLHCRHRRAMQRENMKLRKNLVADS